MAPDESADFVRLLNASLAWTTDESMLGVLPSDERTFDGADGWTKLRTLTYLGNNVETLRRSYADLERGVSPDPAELDPVLTSLRLRFACVGVESRPRLVPAMPSTGARGAAAWARLVIQKAYYSFARYAEFRAADPTWPAASPFRFRVVECADPGCRMLLTSPHGAPLSCSLSLVPVKGPR